MEFRNSQQALLLLWVREFGNFVLIDIVGKGAECASRSPSLRCGTAVLLPQLALLTVAIVMALSVQLQRCSYQLQRHTTMYLGMLGGYGMVVGSTIWELLLVGC